MSVAINMMAVKQSNVGDVMLNNGQILVGTWMVDLTDQSVHLTAADGKEWWFDIADVAAFSPQPLPPGKP